MQRTAQGWAWALRAQAHATPPPGPCERGAGYHAWPVALGAFQPPADAQERRELAGSDVAYTRLASAQKATRVLVLGVAGDAESGALQRERQRHVPALALRTSVQGTSEYARYFGRAHGSDLRRFSPGLEGAVASRRRRRAKRASSLAAQTARYEKVALSLLALTVVGSVLAVGSVHVPALLAVSAVAAGGAAVAVRLDIATSGRVPLSAPVALVLGLAGYTLLQAAPLPLGLLEKVAPANADVWARALLPFGERGPRWASISLNPGATLVEALKWFVYACVFATAAVISSRRGAAWGTGIVFLSGLAAGLTTIAHGLLGATKVFGLYEPHFVVAPWHVGPLLNPNNLAGYLNLSAMCGLGLLLMRKPIVRPWAIGLGVATIVGVAVTAASRAGVLVLPVGILLFALTLGMRRAQSRDAVPANAVRWLVGAAVGGGATFAVLGGTRETWAELLDKNIEKISMLVWAKPMIGHYPWWGIGRGAFESVFPMYRPGPGHVVFTHAENFPAQWMAEWGLPAALVAMAAFAWSFRPRNLGVTRSAVAAGAWAGAVILMLQNLFDLALEVPSVCIAMAAALGSVWGDARRRGSAAVRFAAAQVTERPRLARILPAAVASTAALLMALVARWGWHDVASDREALHARFSDKDSHQPAPRAELRRELRAAMLAHPAEPYFPLLGALVAWVGREESPIPWLERSLERAQLNGRAHLLLADVLAARGAKNQALLELRLAVHDDAAVTGAAATMATRWTRSYEELLRAAPVGKAGAPMLGSCATMLTDKADRATRLELLREALARDPSHFGAHSALASDLVEQLGPSPWSDRCAQDWRAACFAELEEHARAIALATPGSSAADLLRAQALELAGKPDAAEKLLAERCPRVTDRLTCLLAQATVAARIKPPRSLDGVLKEIMAVGCTSAAECAQTSTWAGDVLAGRGEWGGATTYYERATREAPTEDRWLRVANAAGQAGAHARAADALDKVAKLRGGGDAELRRRTNEERARAAALVRP